MFRNDSGWGIGSGYTYIPGAVKRENEETILQARTKAKHINYGDEDHPFRYVLNGQFAGVESRSYNYEAKPGYKDTYQNIVVGTTGQGGKGVFSLNGMGWLARTSFSENVMDNNSAFTSLSDFMRTDSERKETIKRVVNWDSAYNPHTDGPMEGLEKIGYTIGQPILAQMSMRRLSNGTPNVNNDVRIIAFVANGYNGTEEKPSLYVIDAAGADFGVDHKLPVSTNELGKLLTKIEMPVPEDNAQSNALNGAAIVDLDYNNVSDIGYVGDYNGNLYRLDFRSSYVKNWNATLIYKGNPSQPITTTPTVYKNNDGMVTVIFGTGSQIYKKDSKDTSIQAVYGIRDNFNDKNPPVIDYNNRNIELVEQELSEAMTATGDIVRLSTDRNLSKKKGWYINLKSSSSVNLGERVVANMEIVENTLLFNTYYIKPEYLSNTPSGAVCSVPMGYAGTWQMKLNAATGGGITKANANTGMVKLSSGVETYAAGVQFMDRIPPVSISTTKNFPYNLQGQILPGGKLYTPGKVLKPKECDGSDIIVSATGNSGGSDNVAGQVITCGVVDRLSAEVKLLSWRVIY